MTRPPALPFLQPEGRPKAKLLVHVNYNIFPEQACDIREIMEHDPDGRNASEIVRDLLTQGLPVEKARVKTPNRNRLEQLAVATDIDRDRAHCEMGQDIVDKLLQRIAAYKAVGWTPAIIGHVQALITRQRERILRMPEGDFWREYTLRAIDEQVQPLLTPKPRTLHLLKDRYTDDDEAERLRRDL